MPSNAEKVSLIHLFNTATTKNNVQEMKSILESVEEEDREFIIAGNTSVYSSDLISELPFTPLKTAIEHGKSDAALFLVESGANVLNLDHNLQAAKQGSFDALSCIAWYEIHSRPGIKTAVIDALIKKHPMIDTFIKNFPSFLVKIEKYHRNLNPSASHIRILDGIKKKFLISYGSFLGIESKTIDNLFLLDQSLFSDSAKNYSDLHQSWMERFKGLKTVIDSTQAENEIEQTASLCHYQQPS